jgi:bifunctional UDP-N-acetylglucosamine pyrophosphorylase/glucosamine-1-phosphate N-acetyltransferase
MLFHIVILAAGIGKRMKSKKVKVLHNLMGKPMIEWVIDLAKSFSPRSITLIYGKRGEEMKGKFQGLKYALQKVPNGTGAAVSIALSEIEDTEGNVIILSGDTPLLGKESVDGLIDYHKKNNYHATLMTFCPGDPTGYGRIIRKKDEIIEIIEERDASASQKKIKEVNGGVYVFSIKHLRKALKQLTTNNAQGEYYLTDVIAIIRKDGGKVGGIKTEKSWELKGINTRKDIAEITEIMRRKKIESLMENGVTILMPDTVLIEPQVEVGQDTIIYPNSVIGGNTVIGPDCTVGPFVYIKDKKVPPGTTIKSEK